MKTKQIVLVLLVALLMVLSGYAGSMLPAAIALAAPQPDTALAQPAVHSAPSAGALTDFESSLEGLYTQVAPSVVAIQVVSNPSATTPNAPGNRGFRFSQPQPQSALGSGFVWDTQGHIVTNNHVVDSATSISVVFADGATVPAKVVGVDPNSDLAVIQVDVPTSQLHPVQMADSTQVKVGQFAIAIGNPFGEQNTMTTGIISALGRSLPVNMNAAQGPSYTIPDVIQTDAPINPGNSGGVLLNSSGQVVGVTSAIESPAGSSAGIGFAIPAAIVQKVIPALIKTGSYAHPYIGISGVTLTSNLALAMNLKADQRGALVIAVTANGPADKAGLKASTTNVTIDGQQAFVGGDVITAIEGQPVKSFDDIVAYLASSTNVNQTVTLTILRNGQTQTIKVTLTARPNTSA